MTGMAVAVGAGVGDAATVGEGGMGVAEGGMDAGAGVAVGVAAGVEHAASPISSPAPRIKRDRWRSIVYPIKIGKGAGPDLLSPLLQTVAI